MPTQNHFPPYRKFQFLHPYLSFHIQLPRRHRFRNNRLHRRSWRYFSRLCFWRPCSPRNGHRAHSRAGSGCPASRWCIWCRPAVPDPCPGIPGKNSDDSGHDNWAMTSRCQHRHAWSCSWLNCMCWRDDSPEPGNPCRKSHRRSSRSCNTAYPSFSDIPAPARYRRSTCSRYSGRRFYWSCSCWRKTYKYRSRHWQPVRLPERSAWGGALFPPLHTGKTAGLHTSARRMPKEAGCLS